MSAKKASSRKPPAEEAADLRFEEAMERLEAIIGRMESERIPLDDLLRDYEEGTRLLKLCRERIEGARLRVEKINRELAASSDGLEAGDGKSEEPAAVENSTSEPGEHTHDEVTLL